MQNISDRCPLVLCFRSNVSANLPLPLALLYGVCESPRYREGPLPTALQAQSGAHDRGTDISERRWERWWERW